MSGLVAVLAVDPDRTVDDDELQRLVCCYQDPRGPSAVTVSRGASRARAARLDTSAEDGGASGRAGWPVTVGVAHAAGGAAPGSPAWLEAVDGQFALVTWDDAVGEAVVATDPMGMFALY